MKTKQITLCGKQVTLAYCYATEIAYKGIADEEIIDFIQHAIDSIKEEKDPDTKRTLSAIYACIIAYTEANTEDGKEAVYPLSMKQLMNDITPAEFGIALLSVLELRNEFYHTTKGDEATASDAAAVPDASQSGNEEQEKNA